MKHRLWKTLSSVQFNPGQLRKKIYLFLYIDHMSHLNACSCALTVKAIPFTIFNNTLKFILMTCITILFIWLQFFEFCNRKKKTVVLYIQKYRRKKLPSCSRSLPTSLCISFSFFVHGHPLSEQVYQVATPHHGCWSVPPWLWVTVTVVGGRPGGCWFFIVTLGAQGR